MGMNEKEVRQLAKDIFEEQISEEIKKHLDSGIIFKYISDIENQLQSYKQKEDKLREYVRTYKEPLYIPDDLLEFLKIILNEGIN